MLKCLFGFGSFFFAMWLLNSVTVRYRHLHVYHTPSAASPQHDTADKMADPIYASRLVYPGGAVFGAATIKAVKIMKAEDDNTLETVRVPNFSHYESGCRSHAGGCFGHFCRTPNGILLPPQSLSMRTGDITTEYLKAARFAFEGRKDEYLAGLESTSLTKRGTLRSIMSTPVAGSARLIATPMWYKRNIVWISQNLAKKLKTCYKHTDDEGIVTSTYKEHILEQGDYVILIRPPPLNIWNTQPMTVRFWRHDCIGVHPETFTLFHGDYDGDEAHIIPVYHPMSIQECDSWTVPSNEKFNQARTEYAANKDDKWITDEYWDRCEFMNTTTVSSAQMLERKVRTAYGNISRVKDSNLEAMHKRFNDDDTEASFVNQSIRGMKDVCKQQLSQGLIGDMTRVAKIVAMCFTRPSTGGLFVNTDQGSQLLCDDSQIDPGTPAVRAVMSLCEVAQQAALDSHRVQESDMASHDLISDVLLSRPVLEPKGEMLPTLLVFSGSAPATVISSIGPLWRYSVDGGVVVLCKPQRLETDIQQWIIGAYSPAFLTSLEEQGKNVQQICHTGLAVVCSYYDVRLTPLELKDLSYVLSFRVSRSQRPITTRRGMKERSLAWIETLEVTDAEALPSLKEVWQAPCSSTSSMFMSNFSRMISGDTT